MTIEITPRELATILAALRYWQGDVAEQAGECGSPYNKWHEHFAEHEPLDSDEIDKLCIVLNTEAR